MKKCILCGGKALYREGPEPAYYYCSIAHHDQYTAEQHAKGIAWISYGLERIDGRWRAGLGLPFTEYEKDEALTLLTENDK